MDQHGVIAFVCSSCRYNDTRESNDCEFHLQEFCMINFYVYKASASPQNQFEQPATEWDQ